MPVDTGVRLSAEREEILQEQDQVSEGKTLLSNAETTAWTKVLLLQVSTLLPTAL